MRHILHHHQNEHHKITETKQVTGASLIHHNEQEQIEKNCDSYSENKMNDNAWPTHRFHNNGNQKQKNVSPNKSL